MSQFPEYTSNLSTANWRASVLTFLQSVLGKSGTITSPVDSSGNVKVDIAAVDATLYANIKDSNGNPLAADGTVTAGRALMVDLFDPNGTQLLGDGGRYDSAATAVVGSNFSIKTSIVPNRLSLTANTSTTTVTSSATILAASSSRSFLSISNTGTANTLYVNPTGGTASATLGIPIAAGTTYTFPANVVPTNAITAFSLTTTAFVVYG